MNERRRGLGRGLGALIPTGSGRVDLDERPARAPVDVFFPERALGSDAPEPVPHGDGAGDGPSVAGEAAADRPAMGDDGAPAARPGPSAPVVNAYFAEVPLDAIRPNPRQPRQVFDADELAELAASLREVGMLQPVVVRPAGDASYELVMGERRWLAAQHAGWRTLPAIVRATGDDELLRDALLENLHRSQLNPLEEAAAYGQLLEDFGCTQEELSRRIGRSRPQISNTLRLLKLPPPVQSRVAAGVLSAGHARALLALEDPAAQERLAHRIVAEGLSVRAVEEIVAVGGDPVARTRRRRPPQPVAPRLQELAARLTDHLDTRVKVDLGRHKGKIVVEFGSLEDLDRIVATMTAQRSDAQ